jgi:predicted adenylyl cyclase CyaB
MVIETGTSSEKEAEQEHVKTYEIEKRSRIYDEQKFLDLKGRLNKKLKFIGEKTLTTFLFRKPSFIRIRLTEGDNTFIITEKTGDYADKAREEKNIELPLNEIGEYISKLKTAGYDECTKLKTQRFAYQYNDDIKIELNIIDYLGMMVEVEAVTENEERVDELEGKVREIFKELNLEILDAETYQKMMDETYLKATKAVAEQEFK